MRRIKLTVAYDGTNYCGWQVQPNGLAVQEVLNRALTELFGTEVRTIGASRTDTGVHARGNVAVFDTEARMPAGRIAFALNTYLPEDIRIQRSEEVPPDFHPRFTSTVKTYEYKILNRTFPDPLRRLDSLFWYGPLDLEKMRQGAGYLTGTHDFRGFPASQPHLSAENTERTIYGTELWKAGRYDPFPHYRQRISVQYGTVGTLMEIGKGDYPPERILEILEKKDRSLAGATARACGLTLLEIRYPEWENLQKMVDTHGSV